MKKLSFLAVLLVMTLLLTSAFPVAAAAAQAKENTVLSGAALNEAFAAVVRSFTGADDRASVTFNSDLTALLDRNGDSFVTAGEAASSLSSYLFADASTLEGEAARIADEAVCTVQVLENGTTTVYVVVDIENNPALFNLAVFSDAVALLVQKQQTAVAETEGSVSLLTYEQLAGELALHEILYVATDLFGGAEDGNSLHGLYDQAKEATLNIDETRVPSWLINFLGTLLALFQRITAALVA